MRAGLILAVMLAQAPSAPAPAAAPGETDSVRAAVGAWRLSEVGGKVDCTLDLADTAPGPGGQAGARPATAAFACRQAFPPLKALAAWSLDDKGDIVLADAAGKPLAVFVGQAGGPFEAKAPGGKTWRLQAAPRERPVSLFGRPAAVAPVGVA